MRRIGYGLIGLLLLTGVATPAAAAVSISIGLPNVHIGINLPVFPELVRVPGYPVYYAPRMDANYFFYDGLYWVFQNDNWYSSSWYNGPWWAVDPDGVPLFILRIPVGYYRQPPSYFRGWRSNAPPRWGTHWGRDWERGRPGWNKWRRNSAPAPAPLPTYQQYYSGDRYPRGEAQPTLRRQHYRYDPRDATVRKHWQQQEEHQQRGQRQEDVRPSNQPQHQAPAVQDRGRSSENDRGRENNSKDRNESNDSGKGHGRGHNN